MKAGLKMIMQLSAEKKTCTARQFHLFSVETGLDLAEIKWFQAFQKNKNANKIRAV